MTVYVVFFGDYEQRGVWGVFSSMETAELDLHPRGGKCRGDHDIEEHVLDRLEKNTADTQLSEHAE